MKKTIRFLLGDQLDANHSWFSDLNEHITYVMMEMRQETDYVHHHIQKVVSFFAAMRTFSQELREAGHEVIYLKINDQDNKQRLAENLDQIIDQLGAEKFEYQFPDEYRLDKLMNEYCQSLDIEWEVVDSEHFLTDRGFLAKTFEGKKTYLMESFYRKIRKQEDILMEDGEPVGGQWNFDKENRKNFPKNHTIPQRDFRSPEIREIVSEIEEMEVETIGSIDESRFIWPLSRKEALEDLEKFCTVYLIDFGNFQDAMSVDTQYGHHSLVSFALNAKLISPREVVNRVIEEWKSNDEIPLAAVEGYVRQIIGWREFMRGVYWAKMPDYADLNALEHQRKLPKWYWDGDTKMSCLHHAITQSLETAYAHHIQRLMVTGNFALLAMINPAEVDEWYLGIYIDAIEWVEITNTRGMSQFADGGIVGTKPYVSSANYINKMSNYCSSCHYDFKRKVGDKACPFNSFYWNFYEHHRERLSKNLRIGMMYRLLDKMEDEDKKEILQQAQHYLNDIDNL